MVFYQIDDPRFSAFAILGLKILTFVENRDGTFADQRLDHPTENVEARERPCADRVDGLREARNHIFDARAMDIRRSSRLAGDGSQERRLLAVRLDEIDPRPGDIGEEDRRHHARKAGAAADVEPSPRIRNERQDLYAVRHMPAPDGVERRRRDEIDPRLPVLQEFDIDAEPLCRFT